MGKYRRQQLLALERRSIVRLCGGRGNAPNDGAAGLFRRNGSDGEQRTDDSTGARAGDGHRRQNGKHQTQQADQQQTISRHHTREHPSGITPSKLPAPKTER